jgi:tetratricopeptide (TPR) repeat protein
MTYATTSISARSRFLLPALFFLVLMSPPRAAQCGVRVTDPKKAALKLDDIKPAPHFADATKTEPKAIDAQAQKEFEKAKSRFDAQLWTETVTMLEHCIKIEPGYVEARIQLARAALQKGDSKLASNALMVALEYRPRDVSINQLLGDLAWQEGNTPDAIKYLRLALLCGVDQPKSPACVLAHLTLAQALDKSGFLGAAADQLEEYLTAVDEPSTAMKDYRELADLISLYQGKAATMLGDIRTSLDQKDQAALAYERAAREKPTDPAIRQKWAVALANTGRVEDALDIVRKGLKSSNDPAILYDLLKRICDAAGTPERYQAELKNLANESDDPAIRLQLADDLIKDKKEGAAAHVLAEHLASHPDDLKSRMELIRLLEQQDQFDSMIENMSEVLARSASTFAEVEKILLDGKDRKAVELRRQASAKFSSDHPESAPASYLHAVMVSNEDPTRTRDVFESVLKKDPAFGPALVHLARAFAADAEWDETLKTIESALTTGLKVPELYVLQGRAYEALDDMPAAEKALLNGFRLDNKSPEPLFVLAEAADHRRDFDKAQQLCRRILEDVDPRFVPARARLCRFYLNNDRMREAKELLDDAKALKLKDPAIDRCKAHFDLKSDLKTPREVQIKKYCAALRAILKDHPEDVDSLIDLARGMGEIGTHDEALALTNEALKLEPLNYVASELKAQLQFKKSDLAGASKTVQKLLTQRPNDMMYQQMLMELYVDQDKYTDASALIKKLLARKIPEAVHDALSIRLLDLLQLEDKNDELVAQAKKWLQESPDDAARRQMYLQALVKADHKDQAVDVAAEWHKAAPADETVRAQYAEQLRLAGRVEEAKRHLLDWLSDSPDDPELHVMLLQLYCGARDWNSAIEAAQTGMEIPEQHARFENWLGRIYVFARRFDEAIEFYRERAQTSDSELNQRDLINVLMEAEHYGDAEKAANHILEPQLQLREKEKKHDVGTIVRMRTLLALIYQRADQPRKAITQLEELYKIVPDDPGVNNDLGYTYADMGIHLKKAESMIRMAIAERPREAAYLDSLGWVLYKQDKALEGLPYLRRAVRLHREPPDPILLDHLGDALYRTDNKEEARKVWELAINSRKSDEDPPSSEERAALTRTRQKIQKFDKDEAVETAPPGKMSDEDDSSEVQKKPTSRPGRRRH